MEKIWISNPPVGHLVSSWKKEVLRPEDLLYLGFEGINFAPHMKGTKEPFLDIVDRKKPAYLIVHFPPQNIAEEAFFEISRDMNGAEYDYTSPREDTDPPDPGSDDPLKFPAHSIPSGPSRLVFAVPPDAVPLPYTLESLLKAISAFPLQVSPTALPPEKPVLAVNINPVTKGISRIAQIRDLGQDSKFRLSDATAVCGKVPFTTKKLAIQAQPAAGSGLEPYLPHAYDPDLVGAILGSLLPPPPLRSPYYHDVFGTNPPETAIELPYHLILSPHALEGWTHATGAPLAVRKTVPEKIVPEIPRIIYPHLRTTRWTELWHTRLGIRVTKKDKSFDRIDETDARFRTIRAIWTTDWPRAGPVPPIHPHVLYPFRMSLDQCDRENIVHLTSDYNMVAVPNDPKSPACIFKPSPISVNQLMISALGAWFDARGVWDLGTGTIIHYTGEPDQDVKNADRPGGISVYEWKHIATSGRDHFVRVVYPGHLYPFGHRASLVKVTERKLNKGDGSLSGPHVAVLRQRIYIVIGQPERVFSETGLNIPAGSSSGEGISLDRQFPFTHVRILTTETPPLDQPIEANEETQSGFLPRVDNKPFPFHIIAEDIDGNKVEFRIPLFFTDLTYSDNDFERLTSETSMVTIGMSNQRLCLAPSTSPGDTTLEAREMTFGALYLNESGVRTVMDRTHSADIPPYYPALRSTIANIPAVKNLMGLETTKTISFDSTYLKSGFGDDNKAKVFAKLNDTPLPISFGSQQCSGDRSGGMVQPNLSITGISRLMGPVGGDLIGDTVDFSRFNPADFFSDARLFGAVSLKDIIDAFDLDIDDLPVPKFITETMSAVQSFMKDLDEFGTLLEKLGSFAGVPGDIKTELTTLIGFAEKVLEKLEIVLVTRELDDDIKSDIVDNIKKIIGQNEAEGLKQLRKNLSGLLGNADKELVTEVRKVLAVIDKVEKIIGTADEILNFVNNLLSLLDDLSEMRIRYKWEINLKSWPTEDSIFVATPAATKLLLDVDFRPKSQINAEPMMDVTCSVNDFALDLLPPVVSLIRIDFKKIEFVSKSGKKADVNAELGEIKFEGPLEFIGNLSKCIPLSGFTDPPEINVTKEGITAGYSIAVPPVTMGMFSLQNVSIGSSLEIPFIGKSMTVHFNFCEREKPFLLTVAMFGGGGFFGVIVDPSGLQLIEAALEFGASVSMDFGVASGGVSVMGGIYYRGKKEVFHDNGVDREVLVSEFSGYFRLSGEVDVLHLISASLELYMALFYECGGEGNKCWGEAELTIEVEVFLFSIDVTIHCRKTFSGSSPAPPTFATLIKPFMQDSKEVRPWDDYCRAFASVPEVT